MGLFSVVTLVVVGSWLVVGVGWVVGKSEVGSEAVVEKDALGLRSMREVSKVMWTEFGWVMLLTDDVGVVLGGL